MLGQLEHVSLLVPPTPPQTRLSLLGPSLAVCWRPLPGSCAHAGFQGPLALESSSRGVHLCLVVGAASVSLQRPATTGAYDATNRHHWSCPVQTNLAHVTLISQTVNKNVHMPL